MKYLRHLAQSASLVFVSSLLSRNRPIRIAHVKPYSRFVGYTCSSLKFILGVVFNKFRMFLFISSTAINLFVILVTHVALCAA